jgi:hypothetical protein
VTHISGDPHPQSRRPAPQKVFRHCRELLAKAANNPRDRFCCAKCEQSFYRTHCRVCERPIPEPGNARRQLCRRRKCKAEFRRHQGRFYGSRYPSEGVSPKRDKTLAISNGFLPLKRVPAVTVRAGPIPNESVLHCAAIPLDPELVARHARDRKVLAAERYRSTPTPLIGPHDPPVNVLGGYRFPNAPKIDLKFGGDNG